MIYLETPPKGFTPWYCPYGTHLSGPRPWHYELVELWSANGAHRGAVVNPRHMHPANSVYGLYWRPVRRGDETVN